MEILWLLLAILWILGGILSRLEQGGTYQPPPPPQRRCAACRSVFCDCLWPVWEDLK